MDTATWSTLTYGSGHTTETNQRLELSLGSLAAYISNNAYSINNVEVSVLAHTASGSSLELYLHNTKVTSSMLAQAGGTGADSLNVPTSYRMMMYGGQVYWQKNWVLGSVGTYGAYGSGITETVLKMQVAGGNIAFLNGDSLLYSEPWDSHVNSNCYIMVEGWGSSASTTEWMDNLWVRKYVSPEPSIGAFGTEQQLTSAIQSSNAGGTQKDTFNPGETICVYGTGFSPNAPLNIYVVFHQDVWNLGDVLSDVSNGPTSATTDANGNLQDRKSVV
jgi:hypothetical protein